MIIHILLTITIAIAGCTGIPLICHADPQTDFMALQEKLLKTFESTQREKENAWNCYDRMEKERCSQLDYLSSTAPVPHLYTAIDRNRGAYSAVKIHSLLPLIAESARRFQLDPGLLLAVIHTESDFDPLAVSSAGAIGLMQVIPNQAGREAYRYLYGSDWTIRPDYLHAPGTNIELGAAYLHLLETEYFKSIKDPVKRRYLVVCAYNWGPTSVRKNILDRFAVSKMSADKLYALLQQRAPRETRKYLKDVTKRAARYTSYFDQK